MYCLFESLSNNSDIPLQDIIDNIDTYPTTSFSLHKVRDLLKKYIFLVELYNIILNFSTFSV